MNFVFGLRRFKSGISFLEFLVSKLLDKNIRLMLGQASGQHFEIYYNFIDTFTGTLSKYLQVVLGMLYYNRN